MTRVEIDNYRNALVEVEAVLNSLEMEEYEKIPDSIIKAIEINKNEDYIFEYNEELDYENWNLRPETKALLYNIFKKYLATNEQIAYLNEKERIERNRFEKEKQEKYNPSELFKKNADNSKPMETAIVEIKKEKWYNKILLGIKKYLIFWR